MLKKFLASQKLKPFAKCKIGKVYEDSNFPQDSLSVLYPGFEYLEWNFHTVGYFLQKHG